MIETNAKTDVLVFMKAYVTLTINGTHILALQNKDPERETGICFLIIKYLMLTYLVFSYTCFPHFCRYLAYFTFAGQNWVPS